MTKAQIPENENERLEALREYAILDTLPEPDFDGITKLASTICNVPVSFIAFIDENRQVFKSRHGSDLENGLRDTSFCAHAIHSSEVFIVSDATNDPRFHDNPLVRGGLKIVFYAGFPLIDQNGHILGTLCVIDHEPRTLEEDQLELLKILSHQVVQLLELRKKNAQLEVSKNAYHSLFEQNPDGVFSFDLNGRFVSANEAMLRIVESSDKALKRTTFARYVSSPYIGLVMKSFRDAVKGKSQNYNVEIVSAKGSKRFLNITNIPNVSTGKIIGVYGIAKDITEKHQLQENLTMILSNTNESFMIVDKELNISFFNESAQKNIGSYLDQKIFKGKNILDLASLDRIDYLKDLYAKVFQGEISSNEILLEAPGKEPMWISNSFSPVLNEGGFIEHVIITSLNITERKNSQLKLEKSIEQFKNSEQKSRLIMNGSLDAIIWIDATAKITFWNPQSEKTFGWSKSEALGQDLVKLIATDETRHFYYDAIHDYIEKGEENALNVLVEQVAVNKENEKFPIELTVLPIRQNDEISFCVFIRNISERKRFGNKLRQSEKRYRDLFYLSPLPMWVYDLETCEFLDVNDAAVRHYGYSYEEFMSMTLDQIRPEDELGTFEKALNFVKKSVVFHRGDFRHRKKNGEIIHVDVQSNMIEYNGKDARLILAIDITRDRNNELQLKSLTQSLEQKVKERTIELNEANQLLSYEHQQTRDSIIYAKNIQSSILHREYDVLQMFIDSFVLFKPKDKVSGDFFWCHETEDYYLVAVLDCTGHGVPGAMISMVGFQLLNQIVVINGETSPSAVLDLLDKEVNNLFHQNKEESSVDGMDMIYCRISKHECELDFAGAQRPLFLCSSGELTELKGNKLSIGGRTGYYTSKEFEEHKIQFQPGDCIYLTTDGYYSQFGGPKNKVMLKKRMKEILSQVTHLPSAAQLKELENYFEEWQGNEEQVDDVLVIGLRLGN